MRWLFHVLGLAEGFLGFLLATFVPALSGLSAAYFVSRRRPGYLGFFGLGVFVFLFADTFAGSSYLDLSSGFGGGVHQLVLLASVAGGLLVFIALDDDLFAQARNGGGRIGPAVLFALALSIHGLGEGAGYGAALRGVGATSLTDLLNWLGGAQAMVAYVLHKALEASLIAACFLSLGEGRARGERRLAKDLLVLASVFTVPSLLGALVGYAFAPDTTYFFAVAVGASFLVLLRIAKPLFGPFSGGGSSNLLRGASMLLGFLCIYIAALFHS